MMDESLAADRALIATFWGLVAAHGWDGATLGRLAHASGQPVEALRTRFADRLALLRLHFSVVDRAVAAHVAAEATESAHDRLHDALMCRVEALQPNREGILEFADALRRDPLLALALAPDLLRSMHRLLEVAGLRSSRALAPLHAKAMLAVWLSVLRAWREDDSPDLSRTMAEADKALQRAGDWGRRFGLLPAEA